MVIIIPVWMLVYLAVVVAFTTPSSYEAFILRPSQFCSTTPTITTTTTTTTTTTAATNNITSAAATTTTWYNLAATRCGDPKRPPTTRNRRRLFFLIVSNSLVGGLSNPIINSAAVPTIDLVQGAPPLPPLPTPVRPRAPTVEALVPATLVRRQLNLAVQLLDGFGNNATVSWNHDGGRTLQQLRHVFDVTVLPTNTLGQRMDTSYFSQKSKLSGSKVRAALNVYTANLQFGDSYVLTASPEIRKQLIRNDALPDIQTVVTADLDLRDLYRNTIQTAVDDICAELTLDQPDVVELQSLLWDAVRSLNAWFNFIDEPDIQAAESFVGS
jgi:hypothetical protein